MAQLKITDLYKTYDGHEILHGITFDVESGEFLSLLGPSGCGKSTTLRCIAGLERPDDKSGSIGIGEQIFSSSKIFVSPEQRNLGMVFQSYAVWPHLNVFDNVAFPLRLRERKNRISGTALRKKVMETLELVHLSGLDQRFGHELSGGQQQRVALARALAMSPQVLLLDEPLSNLDVLLREELRAEIQRLQRKIGTTTILVTHDQKEAMSLSQRIILMNQGKIEAQGTPESLYAHPPTPFTARFMSGGQSVTDAQGLTRTLIPRRWQIASDGGIFKIISRLYLGNEYEYWAHGREYKEAIKFYATENLPEGKDIHLQYRA